MIRTIGKINMESLESVHEILKKLVKSALNVPVEVIAEVRSMKNRTYASTCRGI